MIATILTVIYLVSVGLWVSHIRERTKTLGYEKTILVKETVVCVTILTIIVVGLYICS